MRVSEAINSRRSMRVFKPDPVPQADIEWIISTATRAASNGNLQPWKLYVTIGKARQRLSAAILKAMDDGDNGPGAEYDVYPKEFTPLYDARRKLVGKQLYTLLGVPRGDAAGMLKQFRKNYDFFDAPVGMILCVERRMGNGQWIDCGIFLDQLMLLAREKGLHTCPQAAFSRYQHVVRRELKIPDDQVVICGLALGKADPDEVPNNLITERAPIQDFALVHRMTRAQGRPPARCSSFCGTVGLYDALFVVSISQGLAVPGYRSALGRPVPRLPRVPRRGAASLEGKLCGDLRHAAPHTTCRTSSTPTRWPAELGFRPFLYPPTWLLSLLPFGLLAVGPAIASFFVLAAVSAAAALRGPRTVLAVDRSAILVAPAAAWVVIDRARTRFSALALLYGGLRAARAHAGRRWQATAGLWPTNRKFGLLVPLALLGCPSLATAEPDVSRPLLALLLVTLLLFGMEAWLAFLTAARHAAGPGRRRRMFDRPHCT